MSKPTVGLIVPLEAKSDKGQTVTDFLVRGKELADAEPETKQWYGVKFSETKYAVFDTFASESDRDAHLSGKIAEGLMAKASTLLEKGPDIGRVEILASLVRPSTAATVGLYVPLVAKPEKAEEVKDFLISVLPQVEAEPGTLQWYAFRKSEYEFGILDTAADESGREAHLKGEVAAVLKAKADLLTTRPNIQKCDILALKVVV